MHTKMIEKRTTQTKRVDTDTTGSGHETVLFNCNCHTFEAVIVQLMYAIACTEATAAKYADLVHHFGQATVFRGSEEACNDGADKLAEIGLTVRVTG